MPVTQGMWKLHDTLSASSLPVAKNQPKQVNLKMALLVHVQNRSGSNKQI